MECRKKWCTSRCCGNKTCSIDILMFKTHLFTCKLLLISIHATACARTINIICHSTVNGVSENFCICICSFLSSIHEKANCIAIFWTVSPHSLGSCHFRGVWATCLPHKGGGVPLSALPKDTTSELAGLFSTISHKCRAPSRELWIPFFKVFWYDSTRGMNP